MELNMAIRFVSAFAATLVLTGSFGIGAQEQRRGWDPPLDTRPLLTIRTGGASASMQLSAGEYVGLVMTPGFRGPESLCLRSIQTRRDPAALDGAAPVAWHVEARLAELGQGEATIDLRWARRVTRADLVPAGFFTSEQRVILREGDMRILDLVRTTRRPPPECDSVALSFEVEFQGPREFEGAAIAYDLWLVQQDADGELVTDRYQVTARQAQQVDYFFRPIGYTVDGRRSVTDSAAIVMNVSGAIRGRVRSDGNIDLTVDGSRQFSNAAGSAAVSSGGRTMLTVRPGETIEVDTDLPLARQLSNVGDLNQVFGKHRTAVRITARRLW